MAKDYSVFDIVGPNMIGPSSSHTAGAARIGKMAFKIAEEKIVDVKFYLHGSFAETYRGHGTDRALLGGILGFEPDDVRIRNSFDIAKENGINFEFIKFDLGEDAHPNTVRIDMTLESGKTCSVMGASIGGGNIKLTEMDGLKLDFNGSKFGCVVEIMDKPGSISKVVKILCEANKNISSVYTDKSDRLDYIFITIETDEVIEKEIIQSIRECDVVEKIIVLNKF